MGDAGEDQNISGRFIRRWRGGSLGRLVLVASGDVDSDQEVEIIALAGKEIKVFDWNGDTFVLASSHTMDKDGLSLAVGQLSSGGASMIIVGNRDRIMALAMTGNEISPVLETLHYPNAYFRSLVLGDVNGDSVSEIIGAASGAQTVYVFQPMSTGEETRLEELGRVYLGGLVDVAPLASPGHSGQVEITTGNKDGYLDVFVPCALAPGGGQAVYSVRRGDSLWRIARRFGSSVESIARANNLSRPYRLVPGSVLLIPKGDSRQ
jgi:hypothetical protein